MDQTVAALVEAQASLSSSVFSNENPDVRCSQKWSKSCDRSINNWAGRLPTLELPLLRSHSAERGAAQSHTEYAFKSVNLTTEVVLFLEPNALNG